jgi:hypothetical protein
MLLVLYDLMLTCGFNYLCDMIAIIFAKYDISSNYRNVASYDFLHESIYYDILFRIRKNF